MKSGVCPKCKSNEVYYREGGITTSSVTVAVTSWSVATTDNYVCTDCGYLESYITKPKFLQKIIDKWTKPYQHY